MDWILVSDKLPGPEESVLIWSDTHDFSGPSIGHLERRCDAPGPWVDEREWVGDEGWPTYRNVTHWMPLPIAPR